LIDEAIAARDFEKARAIAMDYVDLDSPDDGQEKNLYKINAAQIRWMILNGDMADAETLSRELGCADVFWEELKKNIGSVQNLDFRSLYMLLACYPFTATYHPQLRAYAKEDLNRANEYANDKHMESVWKDQYKTAYYSSNVGYNDEVGQCNSIVLQVIDLMMYEDDKKAEIKKMLNLLKPEAVETHREKVADKYSKAYNIDYKLENYAKQQAIKMLKEKGIKL
jgi:hypothetical protein